MEHSRGTRFRMMAAVAVGLAVLLAASWSTAAADEKATVVLLHSYHHGFTWSDSISKGVEDVIGKQGEDVELVYEYMDTRRHDSPEYLDQLEALFARKYGDHPPDVVICSDDHALNFHLERATTAFGGAPAVFCSVSGFDPSMRQGREITGLVENIDIEGTVDIAAQLHPAAHRLVVISDQTRTGQALRKKAEVALKGFEGRLSIEWLDDLTVDDLVQEVSALDRDTIVLLFIFSRDKSGRVFSHERNLELLSEHSSAPIYGVWDFYLGHGIVGGRLTSGVEEGRMAGELALRVLRGEPASSIPLDESPVGFAFDFERLIEFGIDPSAVPPDSRIVNRPDSVYEEYKREIITVVVVFAVLLAVVAWLTANILRRRQAEAALRRSERALQEGEERLRLALKGAELGTWDLDFQEGRTTFDERFAAMLGYGIDELNEAAHDLDSFTKLVHPDDAAPFQTLLERLADADEAQEAEYRLRSKDGSCVWLLSRGAVVERSAEGRPVRATGTHLDISARKQEEAERAEFEFRMQQSQKLESLGLLSGGIAHDFNNLLTGVLGSAELAMQFVSSESQAREHLDVIRSTALRTSDLCRQLLAYSGKGKFVVKPLNLTELVGGLGPLLEVAISKRVKVNYELARELPAVEADATQMQQVVMNLMVNASEAIGDESGQITVTTGVMDCDSAYLATTYLDQELPDGPYVFVEVSDSGSGMDRETLKRLFDPFFTTKFTGRGLGLAATLGIVKGHHGSIKVYSEVGRGTTFKVLLPAVAASSVNEPTSAADADWKGSGTALLVDDEPLVLRVGAAMLKSLGFEVATAADGVEGLEEFDRLGDAISLVVLDLTMPRMGGAEVFAELRRRRPDVRVLLTSGYNESETTNRFAGKGLAGFLQKPFRVVALRRAVREAFEREPSADES